MRIIDADALIESIKRQCDFCRLMPDEEVRQLADLMEKGLVEEVNNAPTIKPIEWISSNNRPLNYEEAEEFKNFVGAAGDNIGDDQIFKFLETLD